MDSKFKHHLFLVISILLVLTQTLPPFNALIPVRDSIIYSIYIVFSLVLFPSLITRRSLIALFVYIFILLLFYLLGNSFYEDVNAVLIEPFTMLVGLIFIEYALKYDGEYKFTRWIVFSFVIADVIMSIISIPALQIQPNIIRMSGKRDVYEMYSNLFSFVIQYQTVHGLPFLFAPLIFLCRKCFKGNKKMFFFWGTVTMILFYIIIRSNAATSLILSALMIIIGFLFNIERFSGKIVARLVILGVLFFIFMQPSIVDTLLSSVQEQMDPDGMSYKRMGELKESIIYGESEGDLESRQGLYNQSLTLFIESPLWGTSSPERIGMHAWVIDRLALLGLLFIGPLIAVFRHFYIVVNHNLKHTKVIFTCGFASMLLLLSLKNSFGQGSWLYGFAFLPLLCRYIDFVVDNKMSKPV